MEDEPGVEAGLLLKSTDIRVCEVQAMTVSTQRTSKAIGKPKSSGGAAAGTVVMLVEDEDCVRRVAGEILQSAGFTVLEAKNGKEALRLVHRKALELRVLVADVIMPGMNGPELAKELLREYPRLKIIFISGYPENVLHGNQRLANAFYLRKPFSVEGLMRAVEKDAQM